MAKLLREMLGAHEPLFSLRLRALEIATGNRKTDISLLSEVLSSTASKMKELLLDPDDTTAEELYATLMSLASGHDAELAKSNGDTQKLIDKLNRRLPSTQIPVVKTPALKKLLASQPPKKVMHALGYRSTDSLLKRAPLDQLLVGSFMLESVTWHRQFAKKLKALAPSDMTMSRPRAVLIDRALMSGARYSHVLSLQCAGLVGVPAYKEKPGLFILTAATAAEALYHVHVRGVLVKINRFDPECMKRIAHYTYTAPEAVGTIAKVPIPWVSVYKAVALNKTVLDDTPEAAVELQDFFWQTPAEAISLLTSRAGFWNDTGHLAKYQHSRATSFNISDIAHDLYNNVPLLHSTCGAFIRSLNSELLKSYFERSDQKDKIMRDLGLVS